MRENKSNIRITKFSLERVWLISSQIYFWVKIPKYLKKLSSKHHLHPDIEQRILWEDQSNILAMSFVTISCCNKYHIYSTTFEIDPPFLKKVHSCMFQKCWILLNKPNHLCQLIFLNKFWKIQRDNTYISPKKKKKD